eukprot:1658843-Pleurochrysis_carterae.AAC.2
MICTGLPRYSCHDLVSAQVADALQHGEEEGLPAPRREDVFPIDVDVRSHEARQGVFQGVRGGRIDSPPFEHANDGQGVGKRRLWFVGAGAAPVELRVDEEQEGREETCDCRRRRARLLRAEDRVEPDDSGESGGAVSALEREHRREEAVGYGPRRGEEAPRPTTRRAGQQLAAATARGSEWRVPLGGRISLGAGAQRR